MAESRKIEQWITVNGNHIPIFEGESKKQAVERFTARKSDVKNDTDVKNRQIEANKKEAVVKNLEEKYKHINPNYKKDANIYDKDGYNNNCVKCALAFEANMRGANAKAKPFRFGQSEDIDRSKNVNKAFNVERGDVWEVGRPKKEQAIKEIELMMTEDFGNNSRAIIQIESAGLRHTMNVINQNGKVLIIDSQNGTQGTVSEMLKGLPTQNVSLFRTDDKSMDKSYSDWAYDTTVTKSERKQRDPHDLIPKDSYTNDAKYQASKKWLSDTANERNSIGTRWLEAYENLEKARDKHVDPELVESLGRNEARMLVWDKEFPDTAEAKQIADKLMARKTELEDEAERHMNVLRRAKREHSDEQRQAYGRPEFKEAHGEYEGFKSNESTTPYVDEKLKEGKAHVVEMTPEQYIHECAHYIFKDSTVEGVLAGRLDTENLKHLTDKMRNGTKMDTPYINYERDGEQPGNQEGLHRAIAAYSLGIEKIPVIIIGKRRK